MLMLEIKMAINQPDCRIRVTRVTTGQRDYCLNNSGKTAVGEFFLILIQFTCIYGEFPLFLVKFFKFGREIGEKSGETVRIF